MGEYLSGCKFVACENQYPNEKLLKQYGDSIFMDEWKGVTNIVTFRAGNLSDSSWLLQFTSGRWRGSTETINSTNCSKTDQKQHNNNSSATWGYIFKSGRTKTCTCIGLCPSKFAILVAASLRWEGYVHKGCWYWARSYLNSASKGCNCTITAWYRSTNAPLIV